MSASKYIAMTDSTKLLALMLLAASLPVYLGKIWVLLEKTSQSSLNLEYKDLAKYNGSRLQEYIEISLLDGTDCTEFSIRGSVLISGVYEITRILGTDPASSQLDPRYVAIISTKCIQESVILHSLIQRQANVSAALLSLSPIATAIVPEVIHFIPPSTFLIDALIVLSRSLSWNRLGVIHDSDYHTTSAREHLKYIAKQQNMTVSHFMVSLNKIKNVEILLQQVEESGAKVLVLLTQEAPQILCAAHHRGMVWPHYGWLLYGSSSPDIKQLPTCRGSHRYLEGTIIPTYYSSLATKASLEDTAIQLVSKASTAATQLHIDLKSALLRMTVPGIPGNLTFHSIQHDIPAVYFIQVRNGTATSVATVHNDTVLVNRWLQEEELPRGTLPVRVNTVYPTWLGALEITVSGTLITITLVLYVYYRKEPEVRATSWTLSLLMLMGCYMIDIYLLTVMLRSVLPPTATIHLCSLLVWISGLGLSYPLILAVLLVKLARVYRIFYHYSQIGKLCSDVALALYVLLLLTPNIVILTVMTALQSYKWSTLAVTHIDHTEILYVCTGDLGSYYTALTCTMLLLVVGVVAVAIKTRKLRHRNFRDAKKVNIFVSLLVLTGISGIVLYKLFSDRGLYLPAYITIHIIHCTLIGLSLGLLFLPKLSPIIYRKYLKNRKTLYSGFAKQLRTPLYNASTKELGNQCCK